MFRHFDNTEDTSPPEFMPCRKCAGSSTPGYLEKKVTHNGLEYKVLAPCDCYLNYKKKLDTFMQLQKAGIPPSILEYKPERDYAGIKSYDSLKKLQLYVDEFPERYVHQSLYLRGPYGTQKTTLARWVGMSLIHKHEVDVYYVLMRTLTNALVEDIYDRADEDPEERSRRKSIIRSARHCDVLILDESFDLSKMTLYKSNYQIPFLDEFIRTRIDKQSKPIIFVSNVPIDRIDNNFSALKDLLSRTIKRVGGELEFKDNYEQVANDFDIEDIFAPVREE